MRHSFQSHGWTIKYDLLEPAQAPTRTVVFVHGTPWSSAMFRPLADAIHARETHRVLLYDLPGYGLSQQFSASEGPKQSESKFEGDTSVKTQAIVLADILSHLEIDGKQGRTSPDIVAHDIAGTIALRTHLIHGCNFSSLLLMDTNTVLPWGDGFYKLARSKPDAFLELPSGIFEAMVRAVIRSAWYNPTAVAPAWEDTLARPWIRYGDETDEVAAEKQISFVRQIAQANDADVAEMLDQDMYSQVRCDVKIIWGENDHWIPREKMEKLSHMLESRLKEFVVVPEAGHLLMLDQPARVAVEVYDWLFSRMWS